MLRRSRDRTGEVRPRQATLSPGLQRLIAERFSVVTVNPNALGFDREEKEVAIAACAFLAGVANASEDLSGLEPRLTHTDEDHRVRNPLIVFTSNTLGLDALVRLSGQTMIETNYFLGVIGSFRFPTGEA